MTILEYLGCLDQQNLPSETLPETNIAPENRWLEDEFPSGMAYF